MEKDQTSIVDAQNVLDSMDAVKNARKPCNTLKESIVDYADYIQKQFDVVIIHEKTIRAALQSQIVDLVKIEEALKRALIFPMSNGAIECVHQALEEIRGKK